MVYDFPTVIEKRGKNKAAEAHTYDRIYILVVGQRSVVNDTFIDY